MTTLRKALSMLCACLMLCAIVIPATVSASAESYIDNSSLIPKYRADKDVKLLDDDGTPDWLAECIFAEARIETCNGSGVGTDSGSYTGTFEDAKKYIIDHYAEMGVNAIWLTPITERPAASGNSGYNGYSNFGPHTVAKSISGKNTDAEGLTELKKFVDYAHSKNVRILLDIETWGVNSAAPLAKEHPELFGGTSGWGGPAFNWGSTTTVNWMVDTLVDVAMKTGIDGYRCDVEPGTSGYKVYGKVKSKLLEKGRKIICMSEHESTRTHNGEYVYDIGEWGVNATDGVGGMLTNDGINNIFYRKNIVDVIKNGTDMGLASIWQNGGELTRYYTMMLSCHDNGKALLKGSAVNAGYCAIFTPFIPLWMMGEEWNNPQQCGGTGVLYFNKMQWSKLDKNREFYETFKKYIRIRRQYPEIFQYFAANIMDANICKVKTTGGDDQLESYARFVPNGGSKAVIIVPNTDDAFSAKPTVTIPYVDAELDAAGEYVVTDLLTGKQVATGTKEKLTTFKANVASMSCGVYMVAAKSAPTTKKTTAKPTAKPTTKPTTKEGGKTDPTSATDPTAPATEKPTEQPTSEPVETEVPTEQPTSEPIETEEPADTEEPAETEEPVETDPGDKPETEPVTTEVDDADLPLGALIGIIAGAVVLVAVIVIVIVAVSKKKKA